MVRQSERIRKKKKPHYILLFTEGERVKERVKSVSQDRW